MKISQYSQTILTLTDTDTDVRFAANVTARNAELSKDMTFTAKLYAVDAVGAVPSGDSLWTGSFPSTMANTVTHVTVPGAKLTTSGVYAVEITTRHEGGMIDGVTT